MKKLKNIIVILISVFLLSGCMKIHSNITINKDKSMKYEVEYLLSDALMNDTDNAETKTTETNTETKTTETTTEETTQKEESSDEADLSDMEDQLEKNGFTVTKIESKDGYSGIKATKEFKSIDDVSGDETVDNSINNLISSESNEKIFKVKKGLFKDTYYYTSKSAFDSNLGAPVDLENNNLEEETQIENNTTEENKPVEATENETEESNQNESEEAAIDTTGLEDLMKLSSEMEFSFTVTLPSKPISHNAKEVSNDGKTLTWKLGANTEDKSIEFSFAFVKTLPLLLVIGGCLLVIVGIVVAFFVIKNKRSSKETLIHKDYDTATVTEEDINKTPEQEQLEQQIDNAINVADNQDTNTQVNNPEVNNNQN